MSFPQDSDYVGIQFLDQASDLSTPAAGRQKLYSKSDGFYYRNSAGTVVKLASGVAGAISSTVEDAATNTVTNIATLTHNSTGTPAANFGSGLLMRGESSTTADREMGRLRWHWAVATDASRVSTGTLSYYDGSTERDVIAWSKYTGTIGRVDISGITVITGAVGTNRSLFFTSSGSTRWEFFADGGTESGSNAGSDFAIGRYSDAGSYIDFALRVTRSNGASAYKVVDAATNSVTNGVTFQHYTSGTPAAGFGTAFLVYGQSSTTADREMGRMRWHWSTATDASRVSVATISVYNVSTEQNILQLLGGGTPTVQANANAITLSAASGDANFQVGAAAGTNRQFVFYSGASARWTLNCNSAAESGSDAGSNFALTRFSDGGSGFGVLGISRAIGEIVHSAKDAATTTVLNTFVTDHFSSGTAAAGYGTGVLLRGQSATMDSRELIRLRGAWTTATDASRKARGTLSAYDTAERDCIMWEASGSAAMVGFYGTAPIAKPAPTGSRGGNAALASLLTALANLGLITDSTSA